MNNIDIKSLVCPHILNMQAYSSARAEYEGNEGVFLDANENSLGSVTNEQHNRYPDPLQTQLKALIAQQYHINTHQLFLGNGSDECINVLVQSFCIPGKDKVMILPPSFAMYEHAARVCNIERIEVLLTENTFQLNLDKMLATINTENRLKIIFICSPNNPTGNIINEKDIETILNNFNGLVVIDEAYQDFAKSKSWISRLDDFKNLVVINTFSKSWGMADARLGALYASTEIIHYMNVIKMPYNINQHTINLGIEALNKIAIKNKYIDTLNENKKWLLAEMQQINTIQHIYPTDANYILFKVDDANALYKHFILHKVIVRNRDKAPLLKGCLRVSVGTKTENKKFIEVLKNYKS